MEELNNKIKNWLSQRGYPLEMQIAKGMQSAGFGVIQSDYYEDPDSGKWRETDIVAYEQHTSETCRPIFSTIIECKGEKDKPWVLFTSKDNYPEGLSVSRRASTIQGESILRVLALKEEVQNSLLFNTPERPGYSLTVALRDNSKNDAAYEALNSVCKAALGQVNRLENVPHENIIPFAWPVIVINAPLFESYLDDEGKLHVHEIKKGLLIWKNPIITRHTLVQIYTKDQLLLEAKDIREKAIEFLKLAAEENDRLPREKQNRSQEN